MKVIFILADVICSGILELEFSQMPVSKQSIAVLVNNLPNEWLEFICQREANEEVGQFSQMVADNKSGTKKNNLHFTIVSEHPCWMPNAATEVYYPTFVLYPEWWHGFMRTVVKAGSV